MTHFAKFYSGINLKFFSLSFIFQRVVSHPKNRGIISRLLDLTSPEAMVSFRSRTIHWSSLMAVHLLHLCPVKLENTGFSARERLARCAVKGSASSSSSTPTSVSRVSSPSKRKNRTSSAKRKKRSKRRSSTATAATRKHLFF